MRNYYKLSQDLLITNFKVGSDTISDGVLIWLLKRYNHITSLLCRRCRFSEEGLIINLIQNLKFLTSLEVKTSGRISDMFMENLAFSELNIKKLDLDSCFSVSDEGFDKCIRRFRHLRYLSLEGISDVTNVSLFLLSQMCPDLEHINLTMWDVNDTGIEALSCGCRNLSYMNLSMCKNITDESLRSIGRYCALLRVINLNSCFKITDAGIETLVTHCKYLSGISVFGCVLSDNSLYAVARECKSLTSFSIDDLIYVTDNGVVALVQSCGNPLLQLELPLCRSISDTSLICVSHHCPKLECLNLQACSELSDEAIAAVLTACRNLTTVNFSDCVAGITDRAFGALSKIQSKISVLTVIGCEHLTDIGLGFIASGFPNLKCLNINGCSSVTLVGVLEILDNCVDINYFYFSGCNIPADRIVDIRSKFPYVSFNSNADYEDYEDYEDAERDNGSGSLPGVDYDYDLNDEL
jgi:F-box/leucine-rich repeat protein 2/20